MWMLIADLLLIQKIQIGKFVRVVGPLRRFGHDVFITAHKVEEISHPDEISRHMIAVAYTFVILTDVESQNQHHSSDSNRGFASIKPPGNPQFGGSDFNQFNSENSGAQFNQYNPHATMMGGSASGSGLDTFIAELQRTFGARGPRYNPSIGVSRQQLHMHFANSFTAKQVDSKIQELHDEGHLFSTCDDNHFQLSGA